MHNAHAHQETAPAALTTQELQHGTGGVAATRASVPTEQEEFALRCVIAQHCYCPGGRLRGQLRPCKVCHLASSQESILRLVFYRRHAEALRRSEALEPPRWREGQQPQVAAPSATVPGPS